MSTISHLFDKNLLLYRLKKTTGNKTTFQSTATVEGALQDKIIAMKSNLGIVMSRNWMAYVDIDANIAKGDQIIYGDKKFLVDEIVRKDYGINQYMEILLKEANE